MGFIYDPSKGEVKQKPPWFLLVVIAMAPVELECTVVDCDHGNDGNRYKTALLEPDLAFRMLAMHRQDAHDEEQVGGGTADLATRSKVEKVKRPILKKGISEDKYLHFSRQWQRYKRSSGMKDLEVVRDQLISCCEEELSQDF